MSAPRRFLPPWSVEEQDACFVVRDHNGQQLAYIYFENEPGRRPAAKLLSKDEARSIRERVLIAVVPSSPALGCRFRIGRISGHRRKDESAVATLWWWRA
jgi:hypothetical protein